MKQKTKVVNISDLMIICTYLDEFEKFNENLENLLSKRHSKKTLKHLDKLVKKDKLVCDYQAKKFYQENLEILNGIAKFSSISNFIYTNYDWKGKLRNDYIDLEFFHEYIKNNRNDLEKIIALLQKIEKLGFAKISFNANMDFSKDEYNEVYSMNIPLYKNTSNLYYLDNMEAVLNYDDKVVKYTSHDSNYIISVSANCASCSKDIVVNSLVFDEKLLPESLIKEDIFDYIVTLKEKKLIECATLKNMVDLGMSIDRIYYEITKSFKITADIEDEESREKITGYLLEAYEYIKLVAATGKEYFSKAHTSINEELVNKETKEALKNNTVHIDYDSIVNDVENILVRRHNN